MKTMHNFLMRITQRMPAKAIDIYARHYIERYHVVTVWRLTILLHRYLGADGDRHLHDHPHKWSLGIPLLGGYQEEKLIAFDPNGALLKLRSIRPWRWNFIGTRDFHRIAKVQPGTWTLFITWHRFKFWGELKSEVTPNFSIDYGLKVIGLRYSTMPETKPTNPHWYRTAITGKELRNRRGTNI